MLQIVEPDWDSSDASALNDFLRTVAGKRMLAKLAYARPSFLPSSAHPHKSFACSREIHGYEQAIRTLLSLIEAEEQQPLSATKNSPSTYPDLDDETQWPAETPE
jgi:hypothetical protein